jgi:hypothetical protein
MNLAEIRKTSEAPVWDAEPKKLEGPAGGPQNGSAGTPALRPSTAWSVPNLAKGGHLITDAQKHFSNIASTA